MFRAKSSNGYFSKRVTSIILVISLLLCNINLRTVFALDETDESQAIGQPGQQMDISSLSDLSEFDIGMFQDQPYEIEVLEDGEVIMWFYKATTPPALEYDVGAQMYNVPTPYANISLSPTTLTMNSGDKTSLTVKCTTRSQDPTITGIGLSWTTIDPPPPTTGFYFGASGFVELSDGYRVDINAISGGVVEAKFTLQWGYYGNLTVAYSNPCTITINKPVQGVTVNPTSLLLDIGQTGKVQSQLIPYDPRNRNVTWSSDNTSIATVASDGTVTAVSAGTTTVKVRTADGGYTSSCTVTVKDPGKVTGVSVSPATYEINAGDSFTVSSDIQPSTAVNKNVTWSSSDGTLATVDSNGRVTALREGVCDIVATTVDGNYSAPCNLTVKPNPSVVASVSISPDNFTIDFGETYKLTANILPTTAVNKNVIWTSNNPSVATVDSEGVVKGVSGGSCNIIAQTEDGGLYAYSTVNVLHQIHVSGVSVNPKILNNVSSTKK